MNEYQITTIPRNHQLTNSNIWTPDSQWLVYDVRPEGASFTGETIEKIHVKTKKITEIYRGMAGAHVGVVTVSPEIPVRYAFIRGPQHPETVWHYDFHHRQGVIVNDDAPGAAHNIDAFCITPPYQAGALRGGTHVHMFSPDGEWLSFTYNDHVLHERDPALDLRNVAVAVPLHPVTVAGHHPREYNGEFFCCVVSKTTPAPLPGSDEISRAYEEGWIGREGYIRPDGTHQRRAIAFIGDTRADNGDVIPEIFRLDLPEAAGDYAKPGSSPLEGTEYTMPAPPAGVTQTRLTFTHDRAYPGLAKTPRFWLRSSPQGDKIAFLMQDDQGIAQILTLSPDGGNLRQITFGAEGIESAFNWDSNGEYLTFIRQGQVMLCCVETGVCRVITARSEVRISGDAVVFSPDNRQVAFLRETDGWQQIWVADTGLL